MARKRKPSWPAWLTTYAILYATYLLFTATVAKTELLAGLAAAAVGTLAAAALGTLGIVRIRPAWRDARVAWRIPWGAIKGTGEVFAAMGRQIFTRRGAPGVIGAVPFDVGGDNPADAARRTLAVSYATMTPNLIVLGFSREQGLLIYHRIAPGNVGMILVELGARL